MFARADESTADGVTASTEAAVAKLPSPVDRKIDFVKDVQPLFAKHCYACHGPEKQESGFRLDLRKRALAGGDYGPAIVKDHSVKSPLVLRVAGVGDDERMPPEGEGTPLTADQVALLRTWIDQGAVWPDEANTTVAQNDVIEPLVVPADPAASMSPRSKTSRGSAIRSTRSFSRDSKARRASPSRGSRQAHAHSAIEH